MIATHMRGVRLGGRLVGMLGLIAVLVTVAAPAAAQIERTCFEQTGYCIEGRIRQFWEQSGGLLSFGYPISPETDTQIEGQTHTIQWFERARIELHPENPAPFDVLLGRVGAERLQQTGRDWATFPKSQPQPGCQFVAETGHSICGQILAYWKSRGLNFYGQGGVSAAESLGLWGLPLSDLVTETLSDGRQYQVQWFERARLELHPENPPPFTVLGGLLGSETYASRPQPAQPAAAPTPIPTPTPPPDRACTATPSGERTVYHKGVTLSAAGFRFRDSVAGVKSSPEDDFLTLTVAVSNDFYRRPDGSPARIFANVDSFTLVDKAGNSYKPDAVTNSMGDRFVGGAVRPAEQRSGKLAFRIPKDAVPSQLIYDARDLNPEYPRVRLDLDWPGC